MLRVRFICFQVFHDECLLGVCLNILRGSRYQGYVRKRYHIMGASNFTDRNASDVKQGGRLASKLGIALHMTKFSFKSVSKEDLPDIHQLNERCVPHVNSIPLEDFRWYLDVLEHFYKVVDEQGALAGTVVVMKPNLDYKSVNYRWFVDRYEDFLYIDRIMVSEAWRGQGVASFIYAQLEAVADVNGYHSLCCEVNLKPNNAESLALHEKIGFDSVGTQSTEEGKKVVSLLMKILGR